MGKEDKCDQGFRSFNGFIPTNLPLDSKVFMAPVGAKILSSFQVLQVILKEVQIKYIDEENESIYLYTKPQMLL